MKCDDARLALEAEPSSADPALAAHVQQCPNCAAHRLELVELDRRLRRALEVPVPATLDAPWQPEAPVAGDAAIPRRTVRDVMPPRRPWSARSFALAASVAGVAVLVGLLWTGFPRESLAAGVVAHMAHEPQAWSTHAAVPAPDLAEVLDTSGLSLRPGVLDVTYAQTCWFRGQRVPHLVVRTASGPVTVMVLPHERVTAREQFDEQGYHGVLLAAPVGTLAVLAQKDAVDVDAVAARALEALRD